MKIFNFNIWICLWSYFDMISTKKLWSFQNYFQLKLRLIQNKGPHILKYTQSQLSLRKKNFTQGLYTNFDLSKLIHFCFPWNHQKPMAFYDSRGNRSWLISLNSLNIWSEIWRRSVILSDFITSFGSLYNSKTNTLIHYSPREWTVF